MQEKTIVAAALQKCKDRAAVNFTLAEKLNKLIGVQQQHAHPASKCQYSCICSAQSASKPIKLANMIIPSDLACVDTVQAPSRLS